MADKNAVSSLGDGGYRITFSQPIKFSAHMLLLAGNHHIRVVIARGSKDSGIGIEGKRESLLDWLRSLELVDQASLKSFEELMTDED